MSTTARPTADAAAIPAPSRVRRALAAALAACALAFVAGDWRGLLLVVDGRVVPIWPVTAVCAVAALVAARRRGRRRAAERPVVLTIGVLALVVGLGGWAGDLVYRPDARVLSPASAQGCHAIAVESSFTWAGRGSVYLLHGESGLAHRVGRFTTDDGLRPFADAMRHVTWNGERGVIDTEASWGTPHDSELDFAC